MSLARVRRGVLVSTLAATLFPAPGLASPSGDVEEVEAVEVHEMAHGGRPEGVLDLVGRLHPAIVHLPIGWMYLVLLADLVAFLGGREAWRSFGLWTLAVTIAASLLAATTGLIRADFMSRDPELARAILSHRNLMLSSIGLLLAAMGVRLAGRNRPEGVVRGLYLALILAAAAVMAIGGHYGGRIVFGPDYLSL